MASIRLYSGDDGESHIEVIDPASHPAWTELQNAKGIVFRALPPGFLQRLARGSSQAIPDHPVRRGGNRAGGRYHPPAWPRRRQSGRGSDRPRTHHPRCGGRTQGRRHHPLGRLADVPLRGTAMMAPPEWKRSVESVISRKPPYAAFLVIFPGETI